MLRTSSRALVIAAGLLLATGAAGARPPLGPLRLRDYDRDGHGDLTFVGAAATPAAGFVRLQLLDGLSAGA
jgi:hypothetical protein